MEEKVKPSRSILKDKGLQDRWWRFARNRPELKAAIEGLDRVLAISRVGQHMAFAFLPSGMVYSDRIIVIPVDSYAAFCALQCRLHEIWVRRFSSTLEDRLCYSPSDCFETYPFPGDWPSNAAFEKAGRDFYEFRIGLMSRTGLGLTKTYNRFHDRYCDESEVVQLRVLQDQVDRAVLDEYGWSDIQPECKFLADHEMDGSCSSPRLRRYRWPDEVESEVLGRLIDLNVQRAAEEQSNETLARAHPEETQPLRPDQRSEKDPKQLRDSFPSLFV